jgi:hypothetical protein
MHKRSRTLRPEESTEGQREDRRTGGQDKIEGTEGQRDI